MGGGKAALVIFLNHIIYLLCNFMVCLFFSLFFRSRGGISFEVEGEDVGEDLDGIDFDDMEALANTGRVQIVFFLGFRNRSPNIAISSFFEQQEGDK